MRDGSSAGRPFGEPPLWEALEAFAMRLKGLLGTRLVSLILHGSAVLGDLTLGSSDLDFVAVVAGDLTEADRGALVQLRGLIRRVDADQASVYMSMLEGAFLPRKMLDPSQRGNGLWWGTTGERPMETNHLGSFVHEVIRQKGIAVYGEDVRLEFAAPTRKDLMDEMRRFAENARSHYDSPRAWVDGLFTVCRMLLWLEDGRLSSKTEAAEWACQDGQTGWRGALVAARRIRSDPEFRSDATEDKLPDMRKCFSEALDELERRFL